MNILQASKLAHKIEQELPLMTGIKSSTEYCEALKLMDELVEDYDANLLLIDVLWSKIHAWEETAGEFNALNSRIENMDAGASMLRLLMEQHGLTTSDFKEEIGPKSSVSMICNEKRNLTKEHIQKLSKRFGISPSLFF